MQPVTMYTYLRINKGYARLKETGMSFLCASQDGYTVNNTRLTKQLSVLFGHI